MSQSTEDENSTEIMAGMIALSVCYSASQEPNKPAQNAFISCWLSIVKNTDLGDYRAMWEQMKILRKDKPRKKNSPERTAQRMEKAAGLARYLEWEAQMMAKYR